jgi:NAD(P)-dependent dehydrogenase (short-subunit alcohol dehydrogenase family)
MIMISRSSPVSYRGKLVLITGAESGLGGVFAERFISLGAFVALAIQETHRERIEDLIRCKDWTNVAQAVPVDFDQSGAIDNLVSNIVAKTGRIDVLINNAGLRLKKELELITEEDWQSLVDLNMKVPFFLSQKVSSVMRNANARGAIINIASQLGIVAARDYSLYSITKAALIGMTRSLALELARYGISVNAVAPGPTNTAKAGLLRDEDDVVDFLQGTPLTRRVEPFEVADAVEFLAANPGGALTGHTLVVDGGWTIR